MAERPAPVDDLDWGPKRARAFTDGVVDIYEELLTRLRDLPVSRGWGVQEVRDAVVIPVPDEPMPEAELLDYLARMTFDYSGFLGHPRFYAYISGAGTVPGAAADLLAAGLNANAGGWRLAPAAVEIELVERRRDVLRPQLAGDTPALDQQTPLLRLEHVETADPDVRFLAAGGARSCAHPAPPPIRRSFRPASHSRCGITDPQYIPNKRCGIVTRAFQTRHGPDGPSFAQPVPASASSSR